MFWGERSKCAKVCQRGDQVLGNCVGGGIMELQNQQETQLFIMNAQKKEKTRKVSGKFYLVSLNFVFQSPGHSDRCL